MPCTLAQPLTPRMLTTVPSSVCSTTEFAGPRTAEPPPDLAKRQTPPAKVTRPFPPLLLAQYTVETIILPGTGKQDAVPGILREQQR